MSPLAFAWRSLVRQPGRAMLGILGIAAIGALLFDMLLLSRGLLVSFRDLLDSVGFDVRVTATRAMPMAGPRIRDATTTVAAIEALPEVAAVTPVRIAQADVSGPAGRREGFTLIGAAGGRDTWHLVEGQDLDEVEVERGRRPTLLINRNLAGQLKIAPGAILRLRSDCAGPRAVLPAVDVQVAGIADFPFDPDSQMTGAVTIDDFDRTCGDSRDEADLLLVASRPDPGADAAVEAIHRIRPDLHAFSNEQLVTRFQRVGFSYFRQISAVLAFVTLSFAFLLTTVLLTVSVNERYAEIAALRALGFARRRIAADLLCESGLLVGGGGLLSLPIGLGVAVWLDSILRTMPGIPANLHFFVFQPRAVVLHVALLASSGFLAALYPVLLAARLPMASTLRNEVIG